jgi:hypothetical protein
MTMMSSITIMVNTFFAKSKSCPPHGRQLFIYELKQYAQKPHIKFVSYGGTVIQLRCKIVPTFIPKQAGKWGVSRDGSRHNERPAAISKNEILQRV